VADRLPPTKSEYVVPGRPPPHRFAHECEGAEPMATRHEVAVSEARLTDARSGGIITQNEQLLW
jgi:hypothetical protein